MSLINEWLMTLAFSLFRPLGWALFFPLLKASSLGSSLVRNGVLFALLLPILPFLHGLPVVRNGYGISLIVSEFTIGLLFGFSASIPFWAVDMAGFLIDTLRGATMGTLFNPSVGIQTSIFGLLFTQFLCALFLLSGGFTFLLSAFYDSYHYLPPGAPLTFNHALLDFLKNEWRTLYRLCLSFSLPAVLCMLLVDLALGLVNRSAQQLNVFFLSMPLKSAMALFLLLLSLPFAFHHYLMESDKLYSQLKTLMGYLTP